MDKNIIKKHLTQRFLSEAKEETGTPGITITNAVKKKSDQENKAGVKAIEKDLTDYSKAVKQDKDTAKMAQNKFNYENKEVEYHDQMEIMNGQEMIEYDREPNKTFKDRAKEGLEGSSRMGNKGGKDMGNAEAMEGVSSDDFGKKRVKDAAASTKKRQDAVKGVISFGDDIETVPKNYAPMAKHSALNEDNNKPQIKETMKRLKFNKNGDKPFEGVNLTQKLGHALTLIPESYKVDNKEFEMTDGSVTARVRWEGTLNEGKAVVLLASDKTLVNEDMQKMKHLMGYKSQETLGTVKGKARLDENAAFNDIWSKTKALLEGEDIESAKAKTGEWEDVTKKAPEASKHIQGSTSKDKGTKAPAAKEGDLDDAVSYAPEAKEHIEGSASTEKGTKAPAPKNGEWEKVKKSSADATKHVTMKEGYEPEEEEEESEIKEKVTESDNIEGTKAANGEWEKVKVPHAAEAKKHIHMGTESKANLETEAKEEPITEGVEINGTFFAPLTENWAEESEEEEEVMKEEEEVPANPEDYTKQPGYIHEESEEEEGDDADDWNKSDDEDEDVDAEPSDSEIANDVPSVDDEDEDDVVVPSAPVAKSGPRLMVSQSTGQYFIVGGGPKPIPVPVEDKEIAKKNPARYLEKMMDNLDDDGNLYEYGDEHGVSTNDAVNAMGGQKKKPSSEVEEGFGDVFRSYDAIFMRNNKALIDQVKTLPTGPEKDAKASEVLKLASKFIAEKGIEVGSANSLKNEVKRAMGYNVKANMGQS